MFSVYRYTALFGGLLLALCWTQSQGEEPSSSKKPGTQVQETDTAEPLPPGATARIGGLKFRQAGDCLALAFLDHGKTIRAATHDGQLHFWETRTGRLLRSINTEIVPGYRYFFFENGKFYATTEKHDLCIWDTVKQTKLYQFRWPEGVVEPIVLSPDGKTMAFASADKTIRLWDLATAKETQQLGGHEYLLAALATVACRNRPGMRQLGGHEYLLGALAFSPDGATLVEGESYRLGDEFAPPEKQRVMRFWDVKTGKLLARVEVPGDPWGMTFSPDGTQLALRVGSQFVEADALLWDVKTQKKSAF